MTDLRSASATPAAASSATGVFVEASGSTEQTSPWSSFRRSMNTFDGASAAFLSLGYFIYALYLTLSCISIIRSGDSKSASFGLFLDYLQKSPWASATLADVYAGILFSSVFVYLRDGPSLLCIPARLVALLIPFFGNLLTLFYLSVLLARERSVKQAFLPGISFSDATMHPGRPRLFFVAFSVAFLIYAVFLLRAIFTETIQSALIAMRESRWLAFTFMDNVGGILFAATYIIIREGFSGACALWIVALLCTGSTATCAYAALMAARAVAHRVTFREKLFTPNYVDTRESFPPPPHIPAYSSI